MYMLLQNSGTSFANSGVDGHKDLIQTYLWQVGSYADYLTEIHHSTFIHSPADTTLWGSGLYFETAGGYYEVYNNLIASRLFAGGGMFEIQLLGRINKCGVIKPRHAIKKDEFEKWERRYLPAKSLGILILTSTRGIISQKEANKEEIGGRLVAYVF